MRTFRHPIRVGYIDTDMGGIVHHATYLRWHEQARVEFFRANGLDYKRFEQEGHLALPVVECKLQYKMPARFDDELTVETWPGSVSKVKVRFDYRVLRGEAMLHEASVTIVCVTLPEGQLRRIPESVIAACGGVTS